MKLGSRFIQVTLLITAYAFAVRSARLVFSSSGTILVGEKYMLLLISALLLLAAHGYWLIQRSQVRRLDGRQGSLQDVTTDLTMSVWEIFFGWISMALALMALYYAAPVSDLNDWYPRLFLCLAVLFGATHQRALNFVYSTLPFVLTITLLALWEGVASQSGGESAALAGFVIADCGLLAWAVKLSRDHGVFSVSQLELPAGAGSVGGLLTGVIRSRRQAMPASGYQLDLSCIRQTKLGGKKSHGEILWHARKLVRGDLPGARYAECAVPVSFEIPRVAPASRGEEGFRISWTLRASAALPDTTFACAFEVPVEARADQNGSSAAEAERLGLVDAPGAQEPAVGKLGVRDKAGRELFQFPSVWNASAELALGAFVLFWTQLTWLATSVDIGWSAWVMFGSGLWFLGLTLAPWRHSVETTVGDGAVSVLAKSLGLPRRQKIPVENVQGVSAVSDGLRAGLIDAAAYYRVELQTSQGEAVRVGVNIRSRDAAERIADEIRQAVDAERAR